MLLVGRRQQQRGGVDGTAGDHDHVGRVLLRLAVALTTTAVTERPPGSVSRRSTRELVCRVTFGCCSAGSTQTTCASAFARTRQAKPSHVAQRMHGLRSGLASSIMIPIGSGKGVRPAPLRSWASCSIRGSWLMAGKRVGRARRRVERVDAALAVHVVQVLGLRVPGLEVVVRQRPLGRDAVDVVNGAEVTLAHAEQDRAVDLGVAADVVVLLRVELLAVLVDPLPGVAVAEVAPDGARVPVLASRAGTSRRARAAGSACPWPRARR